MTVRNHFDIAALRRAGVVYNLGGGPDRSVSILEAIILIEEHLNKSAHTEYHPLCRKGDRQWDVHDVSKFRNDYPDWDYQYSLDQIIQDVCTK
jgi:CDP-paratose 2-epimerase